MLFERVTVIGIGLIGGSFALAGREAGVLGEVIGVARSERTLLEAIHVGAADRTTPDALEAVREADLVYLATPVATIPGIMKSIAPALKSGCVVTDAGSTKRAIMAAAEELPDEVTFVGGHPMAGSEQAGVWEARSHLFHGRTYLLVPPPGADAALSTLRELVFAIGARPVVVSAERHDALVARTSHLPHLVASALANALCELSGERDFIGNGLRDTTRIAEGPVDVWREILLANADEVLAALDDFIGETERFREALAAGDEDTVAHLLDTGRKCRMRMGEQ
ncbi:MAG: prephenate dehydrogenase/arogenate dehydrogenase family protein [Armatimonadota bacterium]